MKGTAGDVGRHMDLLAHTRHITSGKHLQKYAHIDKLMRTLPT